MQRGGLTPHSAENNTEVNPYPGANNSTPYGAQKSYCGLRINIQNVSALSDPSLRSIIERPITAGHESGRGWERGWLWLGGAVA
jgi:hypothetical protein